ncbi:hypothetical protein M3Y97_00886000 [Aphelenchoides bicaudatus]|nr:hypothetical protein M3Y97_00886000 [Aphelenchoides bicaudatus]
MHFFKLSNIEALQQRRLHLRHASFDHMQHTTVIRVSAAHQAADICHPPPYRFHFRSSTSGSDGLSESTSTPKLITLTSGAIRIGGGALPPELCSVINNPDSVATNSQFDQATFPQLVALQQQEFNSQFAQQDLDFEEGFRKSQNAHRIHRSLSDSKYGQNEPIQKMGRLLNSGSQNSAIVSSMNEQNQLTLASSSFQQSKIGNSDPYVSNRGASWTHSQISLSPSPSMVSTVSCPEYPELQEKLRRLAITRDTLSLQVAVLHDQVGAQKEKIRDLETQLDSKRKLYSYEALTNTNQPSTHKTDLLNEIGDLKNRFQMVQREKIEAEKRLQSSQAEIERLTNSIQTLMSQHNIPVQRLLNNMPTNGSNTDENQEMEQLKMIVQKLMADNEKKKLEISSLRSQLSKGSPVSRLHQNGYISDENGVIMGLNAERSTPTNTDQHKLSNGASPAPTPPFMNQKPTQPLDINTQLRKLLVDDEIKENMAHSNSFPASLCSTLGNGQPPFQHQHTGSFVPPGRSQIPPSTSYLSSLSAGAAPTSNSVQQTAWMTPRNQLHHTTSLFAQPTHSQAFADGIHGPASPAARQLAAELDEIRRVSNDSQMRLPQSDLFASTSLPRTLHSKSTSALSLPRSKLTLATNGASSSTIGSEFSFLPPMVHRRGSSVLDSTNGGGSQPSFKGQGFLQRWLGRSARNLSTLTDKQGKQSLKSRSRSEPHLCPRRNAVDSLRDEQLTNTSNESDQPTESDDELTRSRVPSNATSHGKFKRGRGRSTLRNIFGKLTRSTSQEIRAPNFNRGNGIRSSASARVVSLGAPLTGNIPIRPLVNQFCDWSTEVVCEWLAEIGFGTYIPDAERSIRSGRHLLNMTAIDLEKEVGIKNLLHRKKLRCLLNCIERNTLNAMEPADRLDVHQTLLWLDDLGLPQFRDIFAENMIDGQMLLCLTVQDLVEMKVVSAMNHATIARGIQFLRSVDFNTHQLKKTFTGDASQMNQCPEEVEKWAHSCVIQWLKNIDLAEFTPNLMFSGIHGALMVHDPTFTAESLAEVLQIPAHKTLLRRHLTTHFNNIVGSEIISYKRELLTQPNVTFLAPALRIRLLKKGFSLGRKRDKNIIYVEPDYPVCPADVSTLLSSSRSSNSFVDTSNV